jgi:hypothetical protein
MRSRKSVNPPGTAETKICKVARVTIRDLLAYALLAVTLAAAYLLTQETCP